MNNWISVSVFFEYKQPNNNKLAKQKKTKFDFTIDEKQQRKEKKSKQKHR